MYFNLGVGIKGHEYLSTTFLYYFYNLWRALNTRQIAING